MSKQSKLEKVGTWLFLVPLTFSFLTLGFAMADALLFGDGGPGPRGDFALPLAIFGLWATLPGFAILGYALVRE